MIGLNRLTHTLETRWVTPAYSGWVLSGLAVFFFAAATNTMAGWLYVISGGLLALLAVAAVLPRQTLQNVRVTRRAIAPVMAGEAISVELHLENTGSTRKDLIQIRDPLPKALGSAQTRAVETLRPQESYPWVYACPAPKRGIYRWPTVQLRTAAPLGLFWCRRDRPAPARAVVYPTVLNLNQCPFLDTLGQDSSIHLFNQHVSQASTEGLTKALRPYRWGDPTRLIHWRTSARYGELRVRELEVLTSSEAVILALDTAVAWDADCFEDAAIATATLYRYGMQQRMTVALWTPEYGLIHNESAALEVLAGVQPEQGPLNRLPTAPSVIWLTQSPERLESLPSGYRWILWPPPDSGRPRGAMPISSRGLVIRPDQELRSQLSSPATVA